MSRTLTSKIQKVIWRHQNQLCFVHIFLILVCSRIATTMRNSYKACDEEVLKPLLILTLLKIISRYQQKQTLHIFLLLVCHKTSTKVRIS